MSINSNMHSFSNIKFFLITKHRLQNIVAKEYNSSLDFNYNLYYIGNV